MHAPKRLTGGGDRFATSARYRKEIVLTVDGELRRTYLFRAHEQAELSGAIVDTRAAFETRGWA